MRLLTRPILNGHGLRRIAAAVVGLAAICGTVVVSAASTAGATVVTPISAGEHFGTNSFCNQIVIGAGENDTFLNGDDSGPVVDVNLSDTCNVTIEDLTITGGFDGAGLAGGVYNIGHLTLINVNVTGNLETHEEGAGGILNDDGGTMSLIDTSVSRNNGGSADFCTGGILNAGNGTMTISGNSIVNQNVCTGDYSTGGIVNTTSSSLRIYQSSITNNVGPGGTGGIQSFGNLYMSGVAVTGNSSLSGCCENEGGGVHVANDPEPTGHTATIIGGLIANNRAEDGGGIAVDDGSTLVMQGGAVDNNYAGVCGGGIFVSYGGGGSLTETSVQGNTADYGGGIVEDTAELTLTGASVIHNHPSGEDIETEGC